MVPFVFKKLLTLSTIDSFFLSPRIQNPVIVLAPLPKVFSSLRKYFFQTKGSRMKLVFPFGLNSHRSSRKFKANSHKTKTYMV